MADDDECRFLHNEEDASFDCAVDGERRRPINDVDDNVGQSLLPQPQCRDHGVDKNEDEEIRGR